MIQSVQKDSTLCSMQNNLFSAMDNIGYCVHQNEQIILNIKCNFHMCIAHIN